MSSEITEQDFKEILVVQIGNNVGKFMKVEDTEKLVFPGTVKRSVTWQEEGHFFCHKTLTTGRQGQKPSPAFDHKNIQEVFPVEIKNTLFLTEAEIKLKSLYEDGSLV